MVNDEKVCRPYRLFPPQPLLLGTAERIVRLHGPASRLWQPARRPRPAQLTAPRPSPASMTAPPRNAPPALPTLKAEAVVVADSVGASPAFCKIRTCKPGIAA